MPRFIEGEVPDFTVLNDFAGAIAGTEYHIEQRAAGNLTLASEALDFACASLARLVPDTLRLTQSAKPVAPAAALQVAPAAALQIAPAAVPRPEPAVDPEVVIAFHEEAEGLLKAMGAAARREDSSAALVDDLRRQLHTLKGGARLVARQDIAVQAHELESWLAVALSEDESGAALIAGLVPRLRVLAGALGLPREVVDPPALTLPGSRAEAEWAPLSKSSAPLPLGAPPMLVRSDLASAGAVPVPELQGEEPAAADDVVRVRSSLLRE
ncbi:MAG: Hpt domain-containing protein, partial [Pseudomonadales bacterium]